jgi:hypothetical protein
MIATDSDAGTITMHALDSVWFGQILLCSIFNKYFDHINVLCVACTMHGSIA